MNRLVFYTYVNPSTPDPLRVWQLENSVKSLREHNGKIPVLLYLFGNTLPAETTERLRRSELSIEYLGDYELYLRSLIPGYAWALARYPMLHKWAGLTRLVDTQASQLLYVDVDTFFFTNVERLFERYSESHLYAREEPGSRLSRHWYGEEYLNESALAHLAERLRLEPVTPFNTGVVLFNHGCWRTVSTRMATFLSLVWRFTLWMADNAADEDMEDVRMVRERRHALSHDYAEGALPYPSSNRWIKDQVALWLAIGGIPGLTVGLFSPQDVLQGSEFSETPRTNVPAILAHYYSTNTEQFAEWVQSSCNVTK